LAALAYSKAETTPKDNKKCGFFLLVVLPRCENSEISSKTLGNFSFIIFLEFKLDSNEE
jgi:hypothetical protein